MMRVFAIDVLECERCGGRLQIIAAIHSRATAARILNRTPPASRPPPLEPLAPVQIPLNFKMTE